MSVASDVGASAEYFFAAELLSRGIIPCWPSTESMPYDMIIDTGRNRYRVQVKGTKNISSIVDIGLTARKGKETRAYTQKDVDFIVVYLFHYKTWYIFPIKDVGRAPRLKPGDPWCKNLKFRDAWHLLTK